MSRTIYDLIGTGQIDALRQMLLKGCNFREGCDTPLVYAVQRSDIDAARLLLIAGCDPNARAGAALIAAARLNRVDIAELLLNAGADIDVTECAPYRMALMHDNKEMIEWLVAKCAKDPRDHPLVAFAPPAINPAEFFMWGRKMAVV
jgi:hypothetical protein